MAASASSQLALRQSVTEDRLATLDLPEGGCTDAARRSALVRLRQMGLPQRRDEYWKYTRPVTFPRYRYKGF